MFYNILKQCLCYLRADEYIEATKGLHKRAVSIDGADMSVAKVARMLSVNSFAGRGKWKDKETLEEELEKRNRTGQNTRGFDGQSWTYSGSLINRQKFRRMWSDRRRNKNLKHLTAEDYNRRLFWMSSSGHGGGSLKVEELNRPLHTRLKKGTKLMGKRKSHSLFDKLEIGKKLKIISKPFMKREPGKFGRRLWPVNTEAYLVDSFIEKHAGPMMSSSPYMMTGRPMRSVLAMRLTLAQALKSKVVGLSVDAEAWEAQRSSNDLRDFSTDGHFAYSRGEAEAVFITKRVDGNVQFGFQK